MTVTRATPRAGLPLSTCLLFVAAAYLPAGQAQSSKTPAGRVAYSTLQHITAEDSSEEILAKAAKVLPRANQTDWMRLERTFFVHFGPNTFRHVEWGTGREDPAVFDPSALSAEQWMQSVKEGGGKMIILVCKHHDGLSLWPTRYTKHSVAASPWRGGKGNLVREVAEAARKNNIKLGVYLSPADLYQLRTNPANPAGYYGNGSPKLRSTIPTDPGSFKAGPSKGRSPASGFGSYTYQVDDYNRYFLNQLYELLTENGPIAEVWFDGANPDPSVVESYDYNAWYDLIHHLQPHAIIFGKGPDGRWVGNESGLGRTTEWDVIPLPQPPSEFRWPDMTEKDLGSGSKLVPGSYLWWYPAETDVPILHGWFWASDKAVRTASELIDIYYQSVGRNSNLLLNLSPDDRGLIPELQRANLRLMNQVITGTFARNLARSGTLTADTSAPGHSAAVALDSSLDTWWEPAPGHATATLTLTLPHRALFDVVSLQEAVDHRGQRIESFTVEAWQHSAWAQVATGTTVGHKRLLRLASPVTTDRVRMRITGSRLEPSLAEVGLYKQAAYVPAPAISDRDAAGAVTLSAPGGAAGGARIVYTRDGSLPTTQSAVYRAPIPLVQGGNVRAAELGADGKLGMMAAKDFPGESTTGWKVVEVDSQQQDSPAAAAVDGNPETRWETAALAGPHHITLDMQTPQRIAGLTYLPRQDGIAYGLVKRYKVETSLDGKTWAVAVPSGEFANLRNNPELQRVPFPATEARYLRFSSMQSYDESNAASAAEISVVPAKP